MMPGYDYPRRGDVVLVNLDPVVGREIGKTRPAVVVQNDVGNTFSPTIIVLPITGYTVAKARFPFCAFIPKDEGGLGKQSLANAAHIRTIDRRRLASEPVGHLTPKTMAMVDRAIATSLSLST